MLFRKPLESSLDVSRVDENTDTRISVTDPLAGTIFTRWDLGVSSGHHPNAGLCGAAFSSKGYCVSFRKVWENVNHFGVKEIDMNDTRTKTTVLLNDISAPYAAFSRNKTIQSRTALHCPRAPFCAPPVRLCPPPPSGPLQRPVPATAQLPGKARRLPGGGGMLS